MKLFLVLKKLPLDLYLTSILIFMFLERLVFDRSLYADGACYFIWDYLSDVGGKFHNFDRALALFFNHIPYYFLQIFNIKNYEINFIFYKLGFVIPFCISFALSFFLKKENKLDFNILFTISVLFFYLPNSMFAIGEYNLLYAFFPLFVISLKESTKSSGSNSSIVICFLSGLIMIFSYSLGIIFSLFLIALLFLFFYFNPKSVSSFFGIKDFIKNNILIVSLFGLGVVMIIYQYLFLPDVVKRNGGWGITNYLTKPKEGGFSDTWFYFMLFFSFCFSYLFKVNYKSFSLLKKVYLNILLGFILILFLGTNHQPIHSYYSKILFASLLFVISSQFLVNTINRNTYENTLKTFLPVSIIIVFLYVISQGIGFKHYMKSLEKKLSAAHKSEEIFIPKKRINLYDWSWGHECLSKIINPNNQSIVRKNKAINYGYKDKVLDSEFNLHEHYK